MTRMTTMVPNGKACVDCSSTSSGGPIQLMQDEITLFRVVYSLAVGFSSLSK